MFRTQTNVVFPHLPVCNQLRSNSESVRVQILIKHLTFVVHFAEVLIKCCNPGGHLWYCSSDTEEAAEGSKSHRAENPFLESARDAVFAFTVTSSLRNGCLKPAAVFWRGRRMLRAKHLGKTLLVLHISRRETIPGFSCCIIFTNSVTFLLLCIFLLRGPPSVRWLHVIPKGVSPSLTTGSVPECLVVPLLRERKKKMQAFVQSHALQPQTEKRWDWGALFIFPCVQ